MFIQFSLTISFKGKYYLVIFFVESFHTLALDGVPKFGLHNRAAAYRFITLVDVSPFPTALF